MADFEVVKAFHYSSGGKELHWGWLIEVENEGWRHFWYRTFRDAFDHTSGELMAVEEDYFEELLDEYSTSEQETWEVPVKIVERIQIMLDEGVI